ncbi:MAG: hypothetical protein EBZ48_00475 [Proteobacteria bacterium]|nr:hypothetical protein [Pseudomonadota bacterium]
MQIKLILPGMLLLVTAFVQLRSASADTLPSGCYVTDAERVSYSGNYSCEDCDPPSCFNSSDGVYFWLTPASASPATLVAGYGDAVYALINSGYQSTVQSATNYAAYQAQVKLVKRLRSACGVRCKRIR